MTRYLAKCEENKKLEDELVQAREQLARAERDFETSSRRSSHLEMRVLEEMDAREAVQKKLAKVTQALQSFAVGVEAEVTRFLAKR